MRVRRGVSGAHRRARALPIALLTAAGIWALGDSARGDCRGGLEYGPGHSYAIWETCEGALGDYLTVIRASSLGAPVDGAWKIGNVAWHADLWGDDVTSHLWSRDGKCLLVTTSNVYGTAGVYSLNLRQKQVTVLRGGLGEGRDSENVDLYSIRAVDPQDGQIVITVMRDSVEDSLTVRWPPPYHEPRGRR